MNPNTYDHYGFYFQDDSKRYMLGFEAYEQFLALSNQEAGDSGSGPKTRIYIPREREEAEQRVIDDYLTTKTLLLNTRKLILDEGTNNDLNVLYGSLLFNDLLADKAPEAPSVVNGKTYNKCYYLAGVTDFRDIFLTPQPNIQHTWIELCELHVKKIKELRDRRVNTELRQDLVKHL
ncbi:reverse transcriptase domain-containing protein [Tanacetum coccineum]